jgi:hypothetical protein
MKNKLISSGIILVLINIIVLFLLLLKFIDLRFFTSFEYSTLLGLGNYLLFVSFSHFSIKKSNKTFLLVNLGGMVLRLFLMLFVVLLVLNYLKVDQYAFIFGFLFWYLFFLVFEILIVKESFEKI